ncbi:MAG TPA: glycosyltransferase family 9 protein [Actinomycetota bacterium]|nr:glycosyltransferase family 9 protein [Actinomycetota bacterium]
MNPRPAVVDPAPWADARRILCVRTDGIGDVAMTAPAIHALAAVRPDRSITVLASPQGAATARLLPDVDDVIECRAPWAGVTAGGDPTDDAATIDAIRAGRFDAAVIFTVHTQSALPAATWCRLAGVPLRLAHARENPYALLTDWVPDREVDGPTRHETVRQLDLVAHVDARPAGPVRLTPAPASLERAVAALAAVGVEPSAGWVAIHPGASAPSRRYPPSSFARAADLLIDEGRQVVVTCGPADAAVVDEMGSAMRWTPAIVRDLAALGDLVAVLSLADVLVSNNTGPAHLAALVETPVVDLYALTNLQHAPWGVPHRVLFNDVPCRGCLRSVCLEGHHRCLRGVPPEAVVRAVRELTGPARIPTTASQPALSTI